MTDPRVIVGALTNASVLLPPRASSDPGPAGMPHPDAPAGITSTISSAPTRPPVWRRTGCAVYKTRTYKTPSYTCLLHGRMAFGAARAANWNGPYHAISDQPLFSIEEMELEDPFIWRTDDEYEMIVKDMDGRICGQRGRRRPRFFGRRSSLGAPSCCLKMGRRPTLFATSNGEDDFMTAKGTWNMVIPLKESE